MSTTLRPELSDKNEYWIEKHRYYELKHFCLQYPIWRKAYAALDGLSGRPSELMLPDNFGHISDPTARCAEAKAFYSKRIDMVEQVTKDTDNRMWNYILKGVTEGLSYDVLKVRTNIPCCKEAYYAMYRRFFWLLNKVRE